MPRNEHVRMIGEGGGMTIPEDLPSGGTSDGVEKGWQGMRRDELLVTATDSAMPGIMDN